MGNESGNEWLDKMVLVEEPPKFSLLTSDYEETPLALNFFDVVVVNGAVEIEESYAVIKEAERLVKMNGIILCYCENQPLLEENFKMTFPERSEYPLNSDNNIIQVRYEGKSRMNKPEDNWREELSAYYERIQEALKAERNIRELRILVRETDKYIKKAMENRELDIKVELLHIKDKLLDCMF